jgi:uncharacterized protein YbjT (DUF2867 family)
MFLITGATGKTGGKTAELLLKSGADVRVLLRSETKKHYWESQGADVVIGDVTDPQSLTQAFEGIEAAYLMLPPNYDAENYFQISRDIADNLFTAAQNAKVKHVVLLSSLGADKKGHGPIETLHYFESVFEGSNIQTTALRPCTFLESWAELLPPILHEGILPSFYHPLDKKVDMVSTKDIAEVAAKALLTPITKTKEVIEIKGPAAYSPHDVAQTFAQKLKTSITPIAVPKDAWAPTLLQTGMAPQLAHALVHMYDNINLGNLDITQADARSGTITLNEVVSELIDAA